MFRIKSIHSTPIFGDGAVARIVAVYVVVASLWILLSDRAVLLISTEPQTIALIGTAKGWLFVLVTALLLAYSIRNHVRQLAAINEELRQNAERYRIIVEESVDAFFLGGPSGDLIGVGEPSCALTGYTRAELLTMNMKDLFAADELARAPLRYDVLMRGGILTTERRLTRKDGTLVPIEMRSRLMSDGRFQSIFRDVSARYRAEHAVRQSEARLQRAELASKSGNWELHLDTKVIVGSVGAATLYGVDAEHFDYEFIRAVPLPEYRPLLDAALIGLVEHDRPYAVDFKIRKVDNGEVRDIHSVAIFDKNARVLFGVIQDITERKRAEEQLQLAASVFTHTREGILIVSAQGDIVDVNDAFAAITGYSRSEVLGRNPRLLKSGIHPPELYAAMWQALGDTGYWQGELWNRRKDGELYPEMLTISAVRDVAGKTQSYVALFSDISAIKQHQQQLEYIAHYDALTRLPNRVLLAEQLQQAMAQSRRHQRFIAVVYLDLDGFKPVNDRYGHTVGDDLLVALAQRMQATLREGDVLARLGGDEFVAVLVDLFAPEDYEPVLNRLLLAASDPVKVGDAMLQVSASIGVTFYPHDGVDADQLLRHADQAMYQAKQAGKNRYHLFDIAHDAAIKAHHETLERIRRALDLREFVLYYQPKVDMKTGAVFGVEALIRWLHPERGLLAPAAFLPLIENHAIGVELGEWVIDAALQQMSAWRAMGLEIQISVNIGARQLQQPDFVQRLVQLLAQRPDADPARLELEILETSALEDVAKVSELMYACRALGVGFALDDFGTGYSSLTYLKHLPAEMLKIDQTFVRDMLDDANDLAIVEAVVGLARAFRRNAIAEGVETTAHGELLLWLGCDLAQGYGIARPMPASEFPQWAATWRPAAAWTAWRDRRATHDEMAPIFIEVELRHWFNAFEVFLADEHRPLPPLAAHESRFARWRLSVDGARSHLASAGALHDRAYALGRQLVDLHRQGRRTEAQARLNELRELRDECIHALRESTPGIDVEQSA